MESPFQAVCEAAAEQWSVPALAVGISVGGAEETVVHGCDATTRFRIASITKPLTALLVASVLDLDATTGVWPDDVTVRHLLSHMSGFDCELPDGDNAKYGDGDDALARCVADLGGVRRLVGRDVAWSYANTGFWLAALLAAERLGTTYEEAMAEVVLRPAGAEATDFGEPDLEGTGADAAAGRYPRGRRPSGGLVSSVGDLLRIGAWQMAQELAPAQRTVIGKPTAGVYGLGLGGERVGGVEVWGHPGSYGGFQSSMKTIPSPDAVFVGLTNSGNGEKALKIVEDAFFERVLGARQASPTFVQADAGELAGYAGTYENGSESYAVEDAGDGLVVHAGGEEILGLKIGDRT